MNKKLRLLALLFTLICCLMLAACKQDVVSIVAEEMTLEVGSQVDWNGHVKVTVNGQEVQSPQIKWQLVEGDASKAGMCKYAITSTYGGKDYVRDGFVTFDPNETKDVVAFQKPDDAVNKVIGDTVTWTEHVKVTVNGTEVANPVFTAQLIDGEEGTEGVCTYRLSYVYGGETYKTDVKVRYRSDAVEIPKPVLKLSQSRVSQTVGQAIDWNKTATLKVDGNVQAEGVSYLAELVQGNPEAEGECVYKVTATYDGQSVTANFTLRFIENFNPDDVTLLNTIIGKEYDKYTFAYKYFEVGKEDLYISELDKVSIGTVSSWQIQYEDVNLNSNGDKVTDKLDYYFYLDSHNKEVRIYREYSSNDGKKWHYVKYDADTGDFANYVPMAFTLNDLKTEISAQWFENLDNRNFKVKSVYLNQAAEALFGVGSGETYTSIELQTDGTNLTSVRAEYTTQGYVSDSQTGEQTPVKFDSVITLTWSDYGTTTVTLPEATEYVPDNDNPVPDYVDPTTAAALTSQQQTALSAALAKTYQSLTLTYNNDKGDMLYRYSGTFMLTPTSSYALNRELAQYKDMVISDQTTEYYCAKLSQTLTQVWLKLNDAGDFQTQTDAKLTEKYTLTDFGTCILTNELGLSADMFGFVDGLYVVLPDKIGAFKTKFAQAVDVSDYTQFDVMSFAVALDTDGNVISWRIVADCKTAKEVFYWDMQFNYSQFDSTTITLPDSKLDNLAATTAEQQAALTTAFGANYSNATVTDEIAQSKMYFVGDDVIVTGTKQNGEKFKDVYKFKDGKIYEIFGGIESEITQAQFDEYVLNFKFDSIDVTKVKYDTVKDVYYVSAEDVSPTAFAPYYKDAFASDESTPAITGFAFTIQNGVVTSVKTYFDGGAITATATFAQIGTTTVPQDAPESGATEA